MSKTFKDKKRRSIEALVGLDLQISSGEVFGYLGPNGAGKSTTIKTLMGQIRPTSGTAELFGVATYEATARRRVGYLPENPSFYDFLTAREYLSLVGRTFNLSSGDISRESDRVLELLDLQHAAKRPIRGYSKGMVQRLGLAQALLHDPELYILDEPMSGLDPIGRALVKQIILDLKQAGKTVFFSTHVTADVEAVCDRVGVVVAGRLRTVSSVQDVLQDGIEGYEVHVHNCILPSGVEFEILESKQNSQIVYVPREKISGFLSQIEGAGGDVRLIEPKRKDLEAFFLEIVSRGDS